MRNCAVDKIVETNDYTLYRNIPIYKNMLVRTYALVGTRRTSNCTARRWSAALRTLTGFNMQISANKLCVCNTALLCRQFVVHYDGPLARRLSRNAARVESRKCQTSKLCTQTQNFAMRFFVTTIPNFEHSLVNVRMFVGWFVRTSFLKETAKQSKQDKKPTNL